jgi:CRP-like cAMP-binding protein
MREALPEAPSAEDLRALTPAEVDKLFALLSVLCHAYRWDSAPPRASEYRRERLELPIGLAFPFGWLANHLGVPRVGNLYSMVLCNWRLEGRDGGEIFAAEDFTPDALEIAHPWLQGEAAPELKAFLSTAIETEAHGAAALRTCVDLVESAQRADLHEVAYRLDALQAELFQMALPFKRYIRGRTIRPETFMTLIQPTTIWGLDEGEGPLEGASGPQVGCIQVVDSVLGIRKLGPMATAVLHSRRYMPPRHRALVEAADAVGRVLPDFLSEIGDPVVDRMYHECLSSMSGWRKMHKARGAHYLKGGSAHVEDYASTGNVVGLADERIGRFRTAMDERISATEEARPVPSAARAGFQSAFSALRPEEFEAVIAGATRRMVAADTRMLKAGTRRAGIFLLEEGIVRVHRPQKGAPITGAIVARVGPGQVFGEMSFVGNDRASASIWTETDCRILEIDRGRLFQLLEDDGFARRLYLSLATLLSTRLSATSALGAELVTKERPEPRPRVLHEFAPLPDEALEPLERHRAAVAAALAHEAFEALVELSKVCARSPGSMVRVQREATPFLLASGLGRRLLLRPEGYPLDAETLAMLSAPASGDGAFGLAVDRLLRAQPTLAALARIPQVVGAAIDATLAGQDQARVLTLGCGPATGLLAALQAHPGRIQLTATDLAASACTRADALASEIEGAQALFLHQSAARLARSQEKLMGWSYDLVLLPWIGLTAGDRTARSLMEWATRQARPGARVLYIGLGSSVDAWLFDELLDLPLSRRRRFEFAELLQSPALESSVEGSDGLHIGSCLRR